MWDRLLRRICSNFMSQQSLENYHVAVMELISELYHFMSNNELNAQEISRKCRQAL